MKKSLLAVPLLSMSAMSFASEPVALSSAQMDAVTAGQTVTKIALINAIQGNVSPVLVIQANLGTIGSSNTTLVQSGNFIRVRQ